MSKRLEEYEDYKRELNITKERFEELRAEKNKQIDELVKETACDLEKLRVVIRFEKNCIAYDLIDFEELNDTLLYYLINSDYTKEEIGQKLISQLRRDII